MVFVCVAWCVRVCVVLVRDHEGGLVCACLAACLSLLAVAVVGRGLGCLVDRVASWLPGTGGCKAVGCGVWLGCCCLVVEKVFSPTIVTVSCFPFLLRCQSCVWSVWRS